MLEKIANFCWKSLFTDDQQEKELKVETEKRTRFLNERNKLDDQISKYTNSEKEYLDAGRAIPDQLEELKTKDTEEMVEADKKYKAAQNAI